MIYLIKFIIDNGCREDYHHAIVIGKSIDDARNKFYQYIFPKLKYDERLIQDHITLFNTEDGVVYSNYED